MDFSAASFIQSLNLKNDTQEKIIAFRLYLNYWNENEQIALLATQKIQFPPFIELAIAKKKIHEELSGETVELGILLASKALVQMITNPFIGPLTNR